MENKKILTADMIPDDYNYAAVDSDGAAYAFVHSPTLGTFGWLCSTRDCRFVKLGKYFDNKNWRYSLVNREYYRVFKKQPTLKKLTSNDIPKGYNWAAVDPDGVAYAYKNLPRLSFDYASWQHEEGSDFIAIGDNYDLTYWNKSLVSANKDYKVFFDDLTVEDIPEGYNYIAIDSFASIYAFIEKPLMRYDHWEKVGNEAYKQIGVHVGEFDWRNSLVSRYPDKKILTVDDIPEGYFYAAVNSDGWAFAYKEAPVLFEGYYDVLDKVYSACREYCKLIGYGYDISTWKTSLVSKEEVKQVEKFSSFDTTFLKVAEVIGERSKSTRLKVGAVLTKDNRIIATGYNGLVSGVKPDVLEDENGVTKKEVIHAELNCIISCARNGVSCEGATLYITHSPCESCAALIAQSGIKKVVFKEYYRDLSGIEKLKSYGVEVL